MADTTTAGFNFVKPQIGGSNDTWGNKLNANWDSVDTLLGTLTDEKLQYDQNLSDLDDPSAARTNLGVEIGSDVQAYDASLASFAALATAADKLAYTTAENTWAETPVTSFGRSLIDDADAAAGRATLELTAISTYGEATAANFRSAAADKVLVADSVWAAGAEVALTDAATILVDMGTFINASVTLGGNRTLGNPSNAKPGQSGMICVIQDGTGGRMLAFGSAWVFANNVAPVIATSAGSENWLFYHVRSTGKIFASLASAVS